MNTRGVFAGLLLLTSATPAFGQSYSTSLDNPAPADATQVTFDSPLPNGFSLNGGKIVSGTQLWDHAEPVGAKGNYLATVNGASTLTADKGYDNVSFLWGSMDSPNVARFFDQAGQLIGQLTGEQVRVAPTGDVWDIMASPNSNRYVTFSVDPSTGQRIKSISFSTDQNVFEVDSFAFSNAPTPVPEPGTMALFSLGALGLFMLTRRRAGLLA